MVTTYGWASVGDMDAVRALADSAFRNGERVKAILLTDEGADSVFCAWQGGSIVGMAATSPISLDVDGEAWLGMMVGLVCVAEDARGNGIGSRLLRDLASELGRTAAAFLVLWTGVPGFYRRLGWQDGTDLLMWLPLVPETAGIASWGCQIPEADRI